MKNIVLALGLFAVAGCGSGVTGSSGAAACATAATCGITTGISQCTEQIAQVNDPAVAADAKIDASQVNCIARAGANCDAARACLNGGKTPTSCTGDSQSCNGTVWSACDGVTGTGGNNGTRQFDCASSDEKCVTGNGVIDCGAGSCSPAGTSCDKNILATCGLDGIARNTDCSKTASTCVLTGVAPHCRGNGPTCTSPNIAQNALRCDGKVLVSCVDGQEARLDCSQFNLGCFPTPTGTISSFQCALGSDCNAADDTATCEGNVLHFCNNGKFDTFNCGSHGFTGCDATTGGRCTTKTP